MRSSLVPTAVVAFVGCWTAAAQATPTTMTYVGTLTEGGAPVSGTVDAVFRIFDAPTVGTERYTEPLNGVVVIDGAFVAELGAAVLDDALLERPELWLEVTIDGEAMSPRVRLNSVPYALRATLAEEALDTRSFGGLLVDDFAQKDQITAGAIPVPIAAITGLTAGTGLAFSAGVMSISTGGVTTAQIADGTIVNADISSSAVIAGSKLAPDSVAAGQIATDGVTSAELRGGEVTLRALPVACGGGVTTGDTCETLMCGIVGGAPRFYNCSASCLLAAPDICTRLIGGGTTVPFPTVGKVLSDTN